MNKKVIIIICLLIAIISGLIGYIIGDKLSDNQNSNSSSNKSLVGTYYCQDWNGSTATLVLNEDGTCKYPTGSKGKWKTSENTVEIYLRNYTAEYSNSNNDSDYSDKHEATIVNNGIILHDKFFSKMN